MQFDHFQRAFRSVLGQEPEPEPASGEPSVLREMRRLQAVRVANASGKRKETEWEIYKKIDRMVKAQEGTL